MSTSIGKEIGSRLSLSNLVLVRFVRYYQHTSKQKWLICLLISYIVASHRFTFLLSPKA